MILIFLSEVIMRKNTRDVFISTAMGVEVSNLAQAAKFELWVDAKEGRKT